MTIRLQWSLAALFLIPILAGCVRTAEGPQEEQKNPFYLAGKERLQGLDYQGAAESFERALQENPRSVLAHFELGVIYDQHLADYPAALYHYNKAIKMRPTGYPADTIRYRIPACRQELVKADSLAVLNPSALREIEKLREENHELRRQIAELKASVPVPPNRAIVSGGTVNPGAARASTNLLSAGVSRPGPLSAGPLPAAPGAVGGAPQGATGDPAGKFRYHTVRPGETLAAISRTYNVRLDALQSANRSLDPRRLKPGQAVKVPSR